MLSPIQSASRCGQFLIVTAVGANSDSGVFYNRTKGQVEDALRAFAFADGLKIFRPSMLLGPRAESRPGEAVGRALFAATRGIFRGPLRRYRGIYATELARAMVAAAGAPLPGVHVYEGASLFALTSEVTGASP